ncbi:MAG: hypothetical protein FJ225_09990 [Lentisphaerae bacterium]|nr:hypothetical protein [Lentisphaerota bacterium]
MTPSHNARFEERSSAVTLSDMEVFIFPKLIYGLVLANIMSPRIWRWRDDPWFDGLARAKPYRRITRLKQFIMDHYLFNLDLDTWGLTTKERELARFRDFVDPGTLAASNALFGYEGDKYYFDIDIRTHFGLDKYEGNVIPYWKTETVEAMDAFRHRPGYGMGAGECVSLSTLYAAALFIVARIPLEDIYLMATPLHSQNFIDVDDGVLTNNRRLVTRNMWFNGTPLSAQARRALENERVTLVAHTTGCVHTIYEEATIDRQAYARFGARLRDFLSTPLNAEILGNFLRHHRDLQRCFQFRFERHGMPHYVAMESLFAYEHGSSYRVTDGTRDRLLHEVEGEELMHDPLAGRIVFNDLEAFASQRSLDINDAEHAEALAEHFSHDCLDACEVLRRLRTFCHVEPRLPDPAAKRFAGGNTPLEIGADMDRETICDRLESIRDANGMAGMSFYAYRDLRKTEAGPFLAAAVQRNPVSVLGSRDMDANAVRDRVRALPEESIYDGPGRLAQPDEVWNFGRGDGAEKAVLLANILRSRLPDAEMTVEIEKGRAVLRAGAETHAFQTSKELAPQQWAIPAGNTAPDPHA